MKVDVIHKADATLPQHHPEAELAGVRLLTTSSRAFVVLVAGAALSFGVQLGTVRLIGAESFGIFAYVIAWVTMLAYISTLGLSTSLLRLLPTYRVQGDWARAHGVMRFAFRGGILTGIAVAALAIGAERSVLHAQGELAHALLIGAIVVPLMTLRLIGASALRAFGAIIVSMLPERILRDSVAFLILAALVLGGLAPPDAVTAMVATLATAIIALLFIQRFLISRRPTELVSAAPCYAIRDWLRPAVALTLIMLADTIMSRAGILIIGLRNDTLGAGIFAVAFSLAQLVALPRMALSALFAPTVSALYARGDMVALQRLMARSAALSLAFTLTIALPLIAGAPMLLLWFGPQFATAGPVLIVLVLGQLAAAAAGPQQHLFTMTGHERQGATLMAAAAAATILGAALLIIPFGMMGVAIATTLSVIGWNIGMAIFLSRRLQLRPGLASLGNLSLKPVAATLSRWGKAVWNLRGVVMNEVLLNQKIGGADSPQTGRGALEPGSIRNLVAALKQRQVCYCHWKSNIRLGDSLSGKEDLDLLVLRSDATQFFEALIDCGFKLARSRDGGGHPGVLHAFALDPHSLRLVHVHAYFQIVTGDSLVKSYHLPLEKTLLTNLREVMDLPVPAAEAELVVFLLRIALKHTSLVEFCMVNRHYSDIPRELAWLRDQADETAAKQIWTECVPVAPEGEYKTVVAAIANSAHKIARIRIGVGLAWRLREWRRLGYFAGFASRFRRIGMLVASRLRRHKSVSLVSGGALIAMIGPKASGKSTLGAALEDRLGKQLDVRRVHIGKPPATLLSAPFRLLLPMLRRLLPGERSGQYQKPERRVELNFSYAYVVRMLLLAHDRRALLFKSRRLATAGAVVITDRYPPSGIGAIDGRQFGEAAIAACGSRWKAALMRLEAKLYDDLPKPDLVIRLAAPIQTTLLRDASRRKLDGPDPDSVLRRRDLETMAEIADVPVLVINTDVPLEQSVAEVLNAVWEGL